MQRQHTRMCTWALRPVYSLVGAAVWVTQTRSQPLLHTCLQAVYDLVRKLEAQAAEVSRSAGGGSAAR